MEVIKGIQSLSGTFPHSVVTIGNFDGVHLGHRMIIGQAIEKARTRGGKAIAYTFRPHPQVALRPGQAGSGLQLLSTYDEKLKLLEETGLDAVVEEPFSREFSTTAPEQFFTDILLRRLSAEAIVVGYDFAFGKERQGHLDVLSDFCKRSKVGLTVVPPQRFEGEVVSSSRIRQLLLAGQMEEAASLLGRSFSYEGVVIRGDGRGRKIGYPTANLKLAEYDGKLALPYGVYATIAVCGGVEYPSVTNVGVRPTVGEGLPALVETHLLDETRDLYGMTLQVRFIRKLRDEKKFGSLDELKNQIAFDAGAARLIFRI